MARDKGSPKTGGRQKGTPNIITNDLRRFLCEALDSEKENFYKHLHSLSGINYVKAYTNLLGYVIPKRQAITAEMQIQSEIEVLKEAMKQAPDEYINQIVDMLSNEI